MKFCIDRLLKETALLLALVWVVLTPKPVGADLRADALCISGTSSPPVSRQIGKYTVRLSADSTKICKAGVIDNDSGRRVFELSGSGLDSELFVDSDSGKRISGGEAPNLILTSMTDRYGYRYIFASLGEKFEVLKEIVNDDGVHVKRLNKGGPLYLVTWDGALGQFLRDELATPYYDIAGPEVILRLEGHRLLNASGCFPARYDEEIGATRRNLTTQDVAQFLKAPVAKENVDTKTAILRRILNYLYSGREQQAWQTLHEMWPAADQERIKKALLTAYRTGILTQTDGPDHCDDKQ